MKVKYFAVGLLVISAALWLTAGGGSQQIFNDGLFKVYDNGDTTKRVRFEVSGVSTGTTRIMTIPDSDITLGSGGGSTKWDDIGDPDNSGTKTITFDNAEKTIFTGNNDEAGSFFTIQNTDADHTVGPLYLLDLYYSADDGDADADFIRFRDSGGDVMTIQQDGTIITNGIINSLGLTTGAIIVNSIDGSGAVDLDYGSASITDHTFYTDGTGDGEIVLPYDSIGAGEVAHTITLAGNPGLAAGQSFFGANGLIFEGATANDFETLLTVVDPTSPDKTITLPNVTGTVALTADNLGAFAATTSAQLYGVLSDETGSGTGSPLAVFNQSPTIDNPTITTELIATDLIDVEDMKHEDHGEITYASGSAVIEDNISVTNWNLTTPTITTQFTITAQADPTTDADGEFALDTDGWGSGYDAYEVYNGTHSAHIVATQASDSPGNGQVPKWNTGGSITWEDDLQGAGGGDPVLIDATEITDGAGIDLKSGTGVNISLNQTPSPDEATFNFAASEITGGTTWDDGGEASVVWQWDLTAGDPAITFGNGVVNISSGALQEGGNAVWNAGETDIIDSQHYVAGSIDHEHLADDIISGASAVGTFESGDKILVLETGVGLRQADYDDLPGGGAGDSIKIDTVDVTDPDFQSTGDIDFIDTSNIVTANINTDAVDDTHIDWGTSAGQVNPADFVDQDIGDIDIATGVWTIEPEFISGKSDVTGDSADYMLIWDNSDSQLKKIDLGEVLGGGGGNYLTDNAADEMVAATDGVTELIIRNTDNSLAAETYLLELQHTADGSTNGDFIKCTDAYGGTPATLFDVDYQGNVTALTSLVAPKLVGYGDSDTYWQLAANTHKFYAADNLITSQSWGIGGFFSVNSDNLNVDFRYNGDTSNYVVIMDGTNENVVINGGAPATFSANFDLGLCGDGVLCLKETTTPTADTGYGKLYTKNDNKLYFQDGDNGESFLWRDSDTDIIDDTHINWGSLSYLGEEGAITVTDSTSATCYVALWETATGDLPAFSDGGLTYNASTANLSTTTFTGALSGNATTCTTASAGDAAADFFGAGVHAVTDGTACTDIEGTGLSISASTLNWSAASTDLTDTADLLYETELDEFSELQSQIADKTLVNTADGATWSGTHDFKSATVKLPARVIFCFNIRDIDDGFDDIKMTFPSAMTITQVTAYVTGGTNVVGRLYEVDGDGDDSDAVGVETSDWTFLTGETEDTSFNNATFDAGDYIQWDTTSVSGSVTNFSLTVWGYET